MKLVREYINEKFTEDSDPISDMNIGYKEFVKRKLGLEYGKRLPEIFRGKSFYSFEKYDKLHPDTGIGEKYEDQYKFMVFYDIEKINDLMLIQTCWSASESRTSLFVRTSKILSYPVDQFEEELNS